MQPGQANVLFLPLYVFKVTQDRSLPVILQLEWAGTLRRCEGRPWGSAQLDAVTNCCFITLVAAITLVSVLIFQGWHLSHMYVELFDGGISFCCTCIHPWGEDSENRYKSLLRVPDHLVLPNLLSLLLSGGLTCRVLGFGMFCDEQVSVCECLTWFYSWLKWSSHNKPHIVYTCACMTLAFICQVTL